MYVSSQLPSSYEERQVMSHVPQVLTTGLLLLAPSWVVVWAIRWARTWAPHGPRGP